VNDAPVVGRIRHEYPHRGLQPTAFQRVSGTVHGASVTYLVDLDDGNRLLARACRADAPVPVQFRAPGRLTMLEWLVTRAATLTCLEQAGYPAPRLIPTRSGDPVGVEGAWLTLATTYIRGSVLRPSRDQLGMLGAALAELHSLDLGVPPGGGGAPGVGMGVAAPGKAAWYPESALPATLARLDAVAGLVPGDWRPMFDRFRETALAVEAALGGLPRGVVHGDAWPGNAVQASPDSVTLIDWATGGLGLPVLDLGQCLLECLLDPAPGAGPSEPWDPVGWHAAPDEDRIAAIARGYATRRPLAAAERGVLLPAIRFGAAYAGAIHFEQALAQGVRGAAMDARLARLRNRLAVSGAVARLAARHLASDADGR
jgi:Ser/Thr protein kinase RdoA (MazF antagonist)